MHDAGFGLVVSALDRGSAGPVRADGAILAAASGDVPALGRLGVPAIALDPARKAGATLPTIGAANWRGARQATEHLLALGHRRIGVVTGARGGLLCNRSRLAGYRAAFEEAGVAVDPSLVRHGEFEYGSGVSAGRALLEHPDPPTAVFAFSDHLALGVMEAARVRGVAVPDELSVVGFDDLPAARWASPPLTTVRQPLAEMGRLAGETILRLVRGKKMNLVRMEMGTELIVRASTAPVRRQSFLAPPS